MRNFNRPTKINQVKQIRNSQFIRKFIANIWTILIILILLVVIGYSIYTQIAHHI